MTPVARNCAIFTAHEIPDESTSLAMTHELSMQESSLAFKSADLVQFNKALGMTGSFIQKESAHRKRSSKFRMLISFLFKAELQTVSIVSSI
jgi:hypothetical protein